MCREVSVRQILTAMLSESTWDDLSIRDITGETVKIAEKLSSTDAEVHISFRRVNSSSYTSEDVSYELGLLRSIGLISLYNGRVAPTKDNFKDVIPTLFDDLDSDVRENLFSFARS